MRLMDVAAALLILAFLVFFGLFFVYVVGTGQLLAFWVWLISLGAIKPEFA